MRATKTNTILQSLALGIFFFLGSINTSVHCMGCIHSKMPIFRFLIRNNIPFKCLDLHTLSDFQPILHQFAKILALLQIFWY